jgi:hypothetical protein
MYPIGAHPIGWACSAPPPYPSMPLIVTARRRRSDGRRRTARAWFRKGRLLPSTWSGLARNTPPTWFWKLAQLKAAGCEKVFREKITGTTADRPQLRKLMAALAPGDVVIIPAVDRLSRDTTDLLVIARDIQRAGAGLRSLAEPVLDTTGDFAELVLAMLGVAAKLERRRIAERTARGRADAKGEGCGIWAQADPHRASAARSTGAGFSGRTTAQHCPQLQRQSGDDFEIGGVSTTAEDQAVHDEVAALTLKVARPPIWHDRPKGWPKQLGGATCFFRFDGGIIGITAKHTVEAYPATRSSFPTTKM